MPVHHGLIRLSCCQGCSLAHIIVLWRDAYGITVPSITARCTVHKLWLTPTDCYIRDVWPFPVESTGSRWGWMEWRTFIFQLMHAVNKYAHRERGREGATWGDLWVIMDYEYVCAHNEIYKLSQIPRCLIPQHVPPTFTRLTKCLPGHFVRAYY